MPRTIDACMNCAEEREIVAHGLCAKCYMQVRREEDNPWTPPSDRFANEQRKRQSDGRKALITMLEKLDVLEHSGLMPKEEIDLIRTKLATQLERAAVALKSEADLLAKLTVNSEIPS